MKPDFSRMPVVDALKAVACLLIVLHHLAFYGPMSDVAHPLFPELMDWLYEYGRMAVQAFLVMAGFLVARKLAPHGSSLVSNPARLIVQRYRRLALPYFAALTLAIGCAALAGEWMSHDSIPDAPSLVQLLAHAFLLQDLLDQDALSAGVWYVAIDFQLFALTALLLWLSGRLESRFASLKATGLVLVASLTLASLFVFNRDEAWDETAFYFFGSYGLGILSYWAANRRYGPLWLALLGMVVIGALTVEFRERIAVAGMVMLLLGLAGQSQGLALPRPVAYLGRISFSVFLVHFPLLLVVNALFAHFFPEQPVANAVGLGLGVAVSILGGGLFYAWLESRRLSHKMHVILPAGFLASGLLAGSVIG